MAPPASQLGEWFPFADRDVLANGLLPEAKTTSQLQRVSTRMASQTHSLNANRYESSCIGSGRCFGSRRHWRRSWLSGRKRWDCRSGRPPRAGPGHPSDHVPDRQFVKRTSNSLHPFIVQKRLRGHKCIDSGKLPFLFRAMSFSAQHDALPNARPNTPAAQSAATRWAGARSRVPLVWAAA